VAHAVVDKRVEGPGEDAHTRSRRRGQQPMKLHETVQGLARDSPHAAETGGRLGSGHRSLGETRAVSAPAVSRRQAIAPRETADTAVEHILTGECIEPRREDAGRTEGRTESVSLHQAGEGPTPGKTGQAGDPPQVPRPRPLVIDAEEHTTPAACRVHE
jgi:hypothetical protein